MDHRKYYFLIIIIGVLLFIPYLGRVHLFDWDEINFAEAAREMIVTGDYLTVRIDFAPFHEKPPLFIWLQVVSMKTFGINEFAARFPTALIGIISLLFIFYAGNKLYDEKFGLWWVLSYTGSFLPFFYFKTGLIDPTFNLLIFIGIYFLYKYNKANDDKNKAYPAVIIAGLSVGLAIMTKGPVAYLITFLCILAYSVTAKGRKRFPLTGFILFTVISFLPSVIWYLIISIIRDNTLLADFINYQIRLLTSQDAGHGGPFYYHFVILLIGCFPASVFMVKSFTRFDDSAGQRAFKQWNIILLSVILIIFSIVRTKIVHYSSLAYYPISFLSAYYIYHIVKKQETWKTTIKYLYAFLGVIWALALGVFPLALMNIEMILPSVTDKFTNALLRADAGWQGYEFLLGVIYLIAVIVSIFYFNRKNISRGFILIFSATMITAFLFLLWTAPKIEKYTQNAPIEFFRKYSGRNVYIQTLGYKSYAQYFYSQRQPENSSFGKGMDQEAFKDYLLGGNIDKDAYFVANVKSAGKYKNKYGLKELYRKNGFVFMIRFKEKL